jgi:glycerophosphoryl diester phosphodiesterase
MMKYIAHRGASKRYIENTYEAFRYAFESSFDGCECDIRITKDHAFIVYHDKDLLRLNQMKDKVSDLDLVSIQKHRYSDGQMIMTLEQLLDLKSQFNKYLLIEVKDNLSIEELKDLYQIVRKVDLRLIKIISFHLKVVLFFKGYMDVMYLKDDLNENEIFELKKLDILAVNLNIDFYHPLKHLRYIESNLSVSYWTVDDETRQKILEKEEVEFLTTNIV